MKIFFLIFVSLIVAGCSNVDKRGVATLPPYKPEIKIYKQGDMQYVYVWLAEVNNTNKGKRKFMKSIKKAEVNFLLGKRLIKNIQFNPYLLTHKTSDTSDLVVFAGIAGFKWANPKMRTSEVTVEIRFHTDSSVYAIGKYYYKVYDSMVVENNGTLDLIPMEINYSGNRYAFGLVAVRKGNVEEEYVPDSETLRIEIYNHKGKEIWSSNYGMNYMQMIQPVEPEKIGEAHLYLQFWDGKSNNKRKANSDEYKIKYLIPAKPKPYFILKEFSAEFEW